MSAKSNEVVGSVPAPSEDGGEGKIEPEIETESEKTIPKELTKSEPKTPMSAAKGVPRKSRAIAICLSIAGAICLSVAAFLYFRFRSDDEDEISEASNVPYIFNRQFYTKLLNYMNELTHKGLLVLYGPRGVGKTAGIQQLVSSMIEKDGRLVIDFDFSVLTKYSTIYDFIIHAQMSLYRAFNLLSIGSFKTSLLKQYFPSLEMFSTICKPGKIFNVSFVKDQTAYNASLVFSSVISALDATPQLASRTFFEALKSISSLVRPIVILHSPEAMLLSKSKEVQKVISAFMKECELSCLTQNITIIYEISDQMAFIDERIHATSTCYDLFRVEEFSKDDARQIFLKTKTFRRDQLNDLWDVCNGNGKCYETALTLYGEGYTTKKAVKEILSAANILVYSSLLESENQNKPREFLSNLLTSGSIPLPKNVPFVQHFISWKVIGIVNQTKAILENAALQAAVRSMISQQKK